MKQYKVISIDEMDEHKGLRVGDVVTETKIKDDSTVLCRLPKRLYGEGYKGYNMKSSKNYYKTSNYAWLSLRQLVEIVE